MAQKTDNRTDEILARALQQGDHSTLPHLVERHYEPLRGYLLRLLYGQRPLAEDMVQETFLRVLRKIDQYTYPRPFKTWLYAIATHLARDHFSRAHTRREVDLLDGDEERYPALADDYAVDSDLLALDESRTVMAALATLPDHQREVIVLYFYQDLPQDVIAETLAIPIGTVRSRLSLGIKRLREKLRAVDEVG